MVSRSNEGFALFYRENLRALRRYFARHVANSADADELTSETFARVLAATTPERPVPPKAYLYSAAHNIASNHYRAQKHRSAEPESFESDQVSDMSPAADEELVHRQRLAMLWEAVDALPSRQRQAFLMRKVDHLSNGDIAERLGISVSAVEKHIKLGLRACQAYLRVRENIGDGGDAPSMVTGSAEHG